MAEKIPGVEIDVVVAFLEAIELLDDRDRNDDVVFLKVIDATGVVKNDIRIEHQELGTTLRDGIRHRCLREVERPEASDHHRLY